MSIKRINDLQILVNLPNNSVANFTQFGNSYKVINESNFPTVYKNGKKLYYYEDRAAEINNDYTYNFDELKINYDYSSGTRYNRPYIITFKGTYKVLPQYYLND